MHREQNSVIVLDHCSRTFKRRKLSRNCVLFRRMQFYIMVCILCVYVCVCVCVCLCACEELVHIPCSVESNSLTTVLQFKLTS